MTESQINNYVKQSSNVQDLVIRIAADVAPSDLIRRPKSSLSSAINLIMLIASGSGTIAAAAKLTSSGIRVIVATLRTLIKPGNATKILRKNALKIAGNNADDLISSIGSEWPAISKAYASYKTATEQNYIDNEPNSTLFASFKIWVAYALGLEDATLFGNAKRNPGIEKADKFHELYPSGDIVTVAFILPYFSAADLTHYSKMMTWLDARPELRVIVRDALIRLFRQDLERAFSEMKTAHDTGYTNELHIPNDNFTTRHSLNYMTEFVFPPARAIIEKVERLKAELQLNKETKEEL